MPSLSLARRLPLGRLPQSPPGSQRSRPAWWPAWSVPAALRTLRAVLVIPPLFALTYEGFGNLQMALFAAFGGFASLIFASFGGSKRDKIIAHLGLAVIGSIGLIIGTAVNGITWLAVLVTIPVAFGIFFAGVAGPSNAASGHRGCCLERGVTRTVSMIGDRWPAGGCGRAPWWCCCWSVTRETNPRRGCCAGAEAAHLGESWAKTALPPRPEHPDLLNVAEGELITHEDRQHETAGLGVGAMAGPGHGLSGLLKRACVIVTPPTGY